MSVNVTFDTKTARLSFQPIEQVDAPILHQLCSHPQVRRALFDDHIPPRHWVEQEIAHAIKQRATNQTGLWKVAPNGESSTLGVVGLRYHNQQWELCIIIEPNCWQLGYAKESCRALLTSLRPIHLTELHANLLTHNKAGIALCEALGMRLVGLIEHNQRPMLHYVWRAS